jgi:hypothetical protein
MKTRGWLVAALVYVVAAGCSDGSVTAPGVPEVSEAEADLLAMLEVTLQDEYHAEAVYLRVMADHGDVLPFRNIVKAEQYHAQAVLGLYAARGLTAPANVWNTGNVPTFPSRQAACAGGYDAEIENIDLYDRYLAQDLPDDVRRVFTNNRAASVERHMPAFDACR